MLENMKQQNVSRHSIEHIIVITQTSRHITDSSTMYRRNNIKPEINEEQIQTGCYVMHDNAAGKRDEKSALAACVYVYFLYRGSCRRQRQWFSSNGMHHIKCIQILRRKENRLHYAITMATGKIMCIAMSCSCEKLCAPLFTLQYPSLSHSLVPYAVC